MRSTRSILRLQSKPTARLPHPMASTGSALAPKQIPNSCCTQTTSTALTFRKSAARRYDGGVWMLYDADGFSLALMADGQVWSWGDNSVGDRKSVV